MKTILAMFGGIDGLVIEFCVVIPLIVIGLGLMPMLEKRRGPKG